MPGIILEDIVAGKLGGFYIGAKIQFSKVCPGTGVIFVYVAFRTTAVGGAPADIDNSVNHAESSVEIAFLGVLDVLEIIPDRANPAVFQLQIVNDVVFHLFFLLEISVLDDGSGDLETAYVGNGILESLLSCRHPPIVCGGGQVLKKYGITQSVRFFCPFGRGGQNDVCEAFVGGNLQQITVRIHFLPLQGEVCKDVLPLIGEQQLGLRSGLARISAVSG